MFDQYGAQLTHCLGLVPILESWCVWLYDISGVLCFDYCYRNNILITGGLDHNVRIWNPYMPKRAIAVLMGHLDAVTHVQMYR